MRGGCRGARPVLVAAAAPVCGSRSRARAGRGVPRLRRLPGDGRGPGGQLRDGHAAAPRRRAAPTRRRATSSSSRSPRPFALGRPRSRAASTRASSPTAATSRRPAAASGIRRSRASARTAAAAGRISATPAAPARRASRQLRVLRRCAGLRAVAVGEDRRALPAAVGSRMGIRGARRQPDRCGPGATTRRAAATTRIPTTSSAAARYRLGWREAALPRRPGRPRAGRPVRRQRVRAAGHDRQRARVGAGLRDRQLRRPAARCARLGMARRLRRARSARRQLAHAAGGSRSAARAAADAGERAADAGFRVALGPRGEANVTSDEARVARCSSCSRAAPAMPQTAPRGRAADCDACPELALVPPGPVPDGLGARRAGARRRERRIAAGRARVLAAVPGLDAAKSRSASSAVSSRPRARSAVPGCRVWLGGQWVQDRDRSWRDPGFAAAPRDDEPVVCVNWDDARAYRRMARGGKRQALPPAVRGGVGVRRARRHFVPALLGRARFARGPRPFARLRLRERLRRLGGAMRWRFPWPNARCSDRAADARAGRASTSRMPSASTTSSAMRANGSWTASPRAMPAGPQDARAWTWQGGCERKCVRGGSWASRPRDARARHARPRRVAASPTSASASRAITKVTGRAALHEPMAAIARPRQHSPAPSRAGSVARRRSSSAARARCRSRPRRRGSRSSRRPRRARSPARPSNQPWPGAKVSRCVSGRNSSVPQASTMSAGTRASPAPRRQKRAREIDAVEELVGGRQPEQRRAERDDFGRARIRGIDEQRHQPVADERDHEADAAHVAGDDQR